MSTSTPRNAAAARALMNAGRWSSGRQQGRGDARSDGPAALSRARPRLSYRAWACIVIWLLEIGLAPDETPMASLLMSTLVLVGAWPAGWALFMRHYFALYAQHRLGQPAAYTAASALLALAHAYVRALAFPQRVPLLTWPAYLVLHVTGVWRPEAVHFWSAWSPWLVVPALIDLGVAAYLVRLNLMNPGSRVNPPTSSQKEMMKRRVLTGRRARRVLLRACRRARHG